MSAVKFGVVDGEAAREEGVAERSDAVDLGADLEEVGFVLNVRVGFT